MKSNLSRTSKVVMLVIGIAAIGMLASAAGRSHASRATFTKDVAPILYNSCAECHRPGEIAPMSLLT